MKNRLSKCWLRLSLSLAAVGLCTPLISRAEYYSFDVPSGADIVSQEVRWPVWAESTYNAIWTNDIVGPDKTRVYFYGGVPEANPEHPDQHPASIIWSFWPVSHPLTPGDTVRVAWGNPQTYAPLAVGEGASGKASGQWPQLKTKQWYQFVLRVWQTKDEKKSYAAQWMHDPADGRWYHIATMEIPFKAIGTSGASGFIEDFSHGNRNPRRTEFRNVYYHKGTDVEWKPAKNLTPSVRQKGEKGTVDLIDNGTAAFFETCSGPTYKGNLDYDNKIEKRTVTMNQPDEPKFAAPVIESVYAERVGKQISVNWKVAATASPQFAWKVEALNDQGYPLVMAEEKDPEARQAFIDSGDTTIAKIRLILTDIFDHTIASELVAPKPVICAHAGDAKMMGPGLDFAYVQAAGNSPWNQLPRFGDLKPELTGTTNGLDLTVRRRRIKYAIDYTGFIDVPTSGIYAFRLSSYDGSRLIIDGKTIVDNDGIHSYTDKSGTAVLEKGPHPIEVEYFRDTDRGEHCTYADRVNLQWAGPNRPMQPVPTDSFFSNLKSERPKCTLVAPTGTVPNTPINVDVKITNDSTVNRVAYYVDDCLWASRDAAPWSTTIALPRGSFNLHARIFTKTGEAFDSALQPIKTEQVATGPWKIVQIGTPPPRRPLGAAVEGDDSIYLVGDGNGIAWQEVTGNLEITAHIARRPDHNHGTQDDGTTPDDGWAGGILFRADLTAHDTFLGDKFVAVYARADASTHLQCQKDHNGGGPVAGPDLGHCDWIKLQREGNTFTASLSKDGKTWQQAGTRTEELPAKLFVGVFIYSTPGYNPDINAWKFDHVSITHPH